MMVRFLKKKNWHSIFECHVPFFLTSATSCILCAKFENFRKSAEDLNNLPYEHRFEIIYESINGGHVKIHIDYLPGKDHNVLLAIAIDKAEKGHKVELLPILNDTEVEKRSILLNGSKPNKNPDFRINGVFVELEGVTKDKNDTISNAIKNGHDQANHVIINLKSIKNFDELHRIAKGRLKTHVELLSIEFYNNGVSIGIIKKEDGS